MKYTCIAAFLFITDGIIKFFVEKKGTEGVKRPIAQGRLLLTKYHNTGAALNLGEANPKLVSLIALVFTAFLTGVFTATLSRHGAAALKTGLALLLGGAYSNTYDRLRRKYVVDYLSFGVKNQRLRRIVFNVSDFAIIIGAALLVIGELLRK